MEDKSFKVLEYDKIVEMLKDRAESQAGRDRCAEIRPQTSPTKIDRLQDESQEAGLLLAELGRPPLFGIYDLDEDLVYAQKSGVLSPVSLLEISASLRVCQELKDYMAEEDLEDQTPIISDMVDRLDPIKNLQREIDRIILSEEEIADNASSKLLSIRQAIASKQIQVREKMNAIISSNSEKLQENLATIRDGRHVVPVKSNFKNSFPGVVHDQSASGSTVYIEPMAVVELGNDIKILEEDEREEIQRILRQLSQRVAGQAEKVKANQNILIDLDFIFARAKLAEDMGASRPNFNQEGYIRLDEARHPLLGEDVVPISLELGGDFTSLLITGPNTGGKTVTLKTVGLVSLMAQSGLQIPAEPTSQMAIFNSVYADIGDEQSIEQSLSTFSSHMVNIVDILDKVDEKSLVLLDELGSGTDPTEGSALAIAILDKLLERKIRTIATTHYAELKIYALNTPGVENASVEFDVKTLSPTYKLSLGSVGKSNAFEISRRLGLDEDIIAYADSLISSDNRSFEDALGKIEEDRKEIEFLRKEIERKEEDAQKIQARLQEELDKVQRQKDRILEEAREEAAQILDETRDRANQSIKDLNRLRDEAGSQALSKAHEIKKGLDESYEEFDDKDYAFLNIKSDEVVEDLKLGDEVEVVTLGQSGQVVELPNSSGDLVVEIGILKINTNLDSIRRVKSKEEVQSQSSVQNIIKDRMAKNIDTEIDLRGKNIEEARQELDIYLDDAILAGLKEVRVIHGKGTGALRKGVEDYLRGHKQVASTRLGEYGEGGTGVTIASLAN